MADRLRAAVDTLAAGSTTTRAAANRGATSDLTIDEVLVLHAIGWEPVDIVFGLSSWSVPWGVWQYQTGEIAEASAAFASAMAEATAAMHAESAAAGGTGVVGVEVEFRVQSHHVDISLTGTAVRPIHRASPPQARGKSRAPVAFVSDLSARDSRCWSGADGGRWVWSPAPASWSHRDARPVSGRLSRGRTWS